MDGDGDFRPLDPPFTVVVPVRPGPVEPMSSLDRARDELDDAIADVFGEPDRAGVGTFDAVLLLGGAAAIIAGLTTLVPAWVIVVGIVVFALGSVLPLRMFWRRRSAVRRAARLHREIGDGVVLRTDHRAVGDLLAAHQRCLDVATGLASPRRAEVDGVAHAAVLEVATMLDGRSPSTPAEVDDIEARVAALRRLAAAATDPTVGDGDAEARRGPA